MKRGNIIFGFIGIVLGVYVFWKTSSFPIDNIMRLGPGFFPRLLAGGLILFSVLLIVTTLLQTTGHEDVEFDLKNPEIQRAGIALLLTILYVFVVTGLGFIITTILYLLSLMFLMKLRKWVQMIIVSIGVSLAVYLVFNVLLSISLPSGILG